DLARRRAEAAEREGALEGPGLDDDPHRLRERARAEEATLDQSLEERRRPCGHAGQREHGRRADEEQEPRRAGRSRAPRGVERGSEPGHRMPAVGRIAEGDVEGHGSQEYGPGGTAHDAIALYSSRKTSGSLTLSVRGGRWSGKGSGAIRLTA